MNGIIDDNEIPVFLINGFLDGGKTSFIAYTLSEEYFHIEGNTILLVCEDGEVQYDKRLLKRENVTRIDIDSKEELTKERFEQLNSLYRPERVLIEYNGMWGDPGELIFPDEWVIYQQLTVMDGTTIGMYLNNMKALMGPMLKNSELCIVNRCDDKTDAELLEYKRKLRPMLVSGSTVVMENKYGEIELETLDEELPYDVKADIIEIGNEDYGIWFIDAKDYPQRYLGKKVSFTAQIMKPKGLKKGEFVPVRMVMTCCEADMQPLGYIAYSKDLDAYKDGDWVKLTAEFKTENRSEYRGEGPYLNILSMTLTGPVSGAAGF